jgi:archaetidylinositol phosphate synthase
MAAIVQTPGFRSATRTQDSLLAPLERPALQWLAARMPRWVSSDHLTLLGAAGMAGAGLCFWAGGRNRYALLGVVVCLAVNWFGDSLDGTVARYRNQQRPRYGFYVDHIIDVVGALFLLGGLALSGFVTPAVAALMLITFYLLSIEAYLATYTIAQFRLSHFKFSPTELRILLSIGAVVLMYRPYAHIAGRAYKLFDVGGVIGAAGMAFIFVWSATRNTIRLYREERV